MNGSMPGMAQMAEWTEELPKQIADALAAARDRGWPAFSPHTSGSLHTAGRPQAHHRVIMGMGGSGISGRLAALILNDRLSEPVHFVGDGALPGWIDEKTDLLVVSYSGQTWEALGAWEEGTRRGARLSAITSGGALLQRARAQGRPCFEVPEGYAPRAALGWMLAPAALWLDRNDRVVADSAHAHEQSREPGAPVAPLRPVAAFHEDLMRAAAFLSELRATRGPEALGVDPVELGRSMANRPVFLYASTEAALPVAQRWKSQLAENAKQMAQVGSFPEVTHNEVEAWSDPARAGAPSPGESPLCIVLEPDPAHAERQRAIDAMLDEVRKAGGDVRRIVPPVGHGGVLPAASWIERVLALLWLGDLASLACAQARGVDPLSIPALDRVKARVRGG